MFGRHWQNSVLFYHFWEIKHHNQISNTMAKFHISLQRRRIASQFLHWSFVSKNSHFFALDRQKSSKSSFWGTTDKIQYFFVCFGKLSTTAIPRPSSTYHYKGEEKSVSFCIKTFRVYNPNLRTWMPKISKNCVFGRWSQNLVLFVPFGKCPRAKPVIPWPMFTYHCEEGG